MKEHGYSTSVPSVGLCHASLLGTPSFLRIVPAFRPLKALLWILLLPRPLDFQVAMGFQITIVFQNLMIQDFSRLFRPLLSRVYVLVSTLIMNIVAPSS